MEARISIFYKEEFGYLIMPSAIIKNLGLWGSLPITTILQPNSQLLDLETAIWENLKISFESEEVDRDVITSNKAWLKTGYRSYGQFSKNFQMVTICVSGDTVKVENSLSTSQGFAPSESPPVIISKRNILEGTTYVANATVSYFNELIQDISEISIFRTLNETPVSFVEPNLDLFENRGDGHSDFYQLYVHHDFQNTYLAFSIDSGYESFDESDIKSSFEQYYGELLNYTYSTVENKAYKVCIEAQTNQSKIVSYLFEDGEDFLEVFYVIDLEAPKSDIETIQKECEAVIESIKIS